MKAILGVAGRKFSPVFLVITVAIVISFITRTALMLQSAAGAHFTFSAIVLSFIIGLFYDLAMCAYLIVPLVLHVWLYNEKTYAPKVRRVVAATYIVLIGLLLFTNLIPADFNADLRKAVIALVILRFLIFCLLLFSTAGFRKKWRSWVLYIDFFVITFLLLFNAASEWFFWQEFSTRYNFIAVDYLVYTNEVIGNIRQSYPVNWLLFITGVISLGIVLLVKNKLRHSVYAPASFVSRTVVAGCLLAAAALTYFGVKEEWKNFSKNEYANELAGNGIYEFGYAFWHNQLDFYKFYATLPDQEAFTLLRNSLQDAHSTFISNDVFNIERAVAYDEPEQHNNVVLISVESLSAEYMKHFGGTKNITPYLDSLADKSMLFSNLYASGTRTVRGLEALSLSIPPTPGQSIVKRPDNENLFSLGSIFKSKGYITQYIYGGYGYFDNMSYFFTHNGYQVIDRTALKETEIHYQNIWGVADEDLFTLAVRTLDSNYAKHQPFFTHIMTVSNHRPFTYPDNRIDIPAKTQSREGAVKYTDYAINKFIRDAAEKPWFAHTIFVIVADHCAGSAGSVQLPVTGYHIPLIIYAPKLIQPQVVSRMTAQIDIPPTVLGLLKFRYTSQFFGQDIFSQPEEKERAFISTYQGLGFLTHNRLIIQSPVKKVKEFIPDYITGDAREVPVTDSIRRQAIAYYQCASWLVKHHRFRAVK